MYKMWTVDGVSQFCVALFICQMWKGWSLVFWLCCLSPLPESLTLSSPLSSLLIILVTTESTQAGDRSLGITYVGQALWQLCQKGVIFQVMTPELRHLREVRDGIWVQAGETQGLGSILGTHCLRPPFLEKDVAGLLYSFLCLQISKILMKCFLKNENQYKNLWWIKYKNFK